MRALFILLLITLITAAPFAQAADVLQKTADEETTALEDLEEALNLDGNTEAVLDNLNHKELINRYYKFCISKGDKIMSEITHKMACGCTAARMQQTMNRKDIRALFADTKEGAFQRSRAMSFAKLPCMKDPIYDTLYEECHTNTNIRQSLSRFGLVCGCIASKLSDFATNKGANFYSSSDRQGIASPDALMNNTLADFMKTPAYKLKSEYFTTQCIYEHQYGI